jgi:hypothetical protein
MANLLQSIGQAKPVSEFVNMALKYQEEGSQNAIRNEQMKKMKAENEALAKDNEELHPEAAVKLFPEEYQPYIMDAWKTGGALEPNGMIKRVNARNTPKYIESHAKSAIGINNMRIEVLDKELKKLQGLDDPKSAERKLEIVKEQSDLQSRIDQASGKEKTGPVVVPEHSNLRDAKSGKIIGEPAKPSVKKSYVDPEDGTIVNQLATGSFEKEGKPFTGDLKSLQEVGAPKEILNDFSTFYRGQKEANPNATEQQISKAWHDQKLAESTAAGRGRADVWKEIAGDIRQTPVYDKELGSITFATANEIKANPDRFAPPGAQQKAQGQQALIQDIKGQIGRTSTALTNMRSEFSPDQRAKLVLVLQHRDPGSAWSNFMGSNWASTLSDDQKDYVVSLLQLKEQSMAMRSILGAGQGSDMLREAIDKTLPGMISPDRKFAQKQLNEFNQTIYRLEKYVPKASPTPGVEQPAPLSGPSVMEKRTLPNGQVWESLSDGTFRQVK